MNKYQLYTLGGALLAATSLSGAASAAVGTFATGNNGVIGAAAKLSNLAISPTASTANAQVIGFNAAGGAAAIGFVNSYKGSFNLNITIPISGGAAFSGTPVVHYLLRGPAGGTFLNTISNANLTVGTAPTVSNLSNTIFISNASVSLAGVTTGNNSGKTAAIGGLLISPLLFTNLSALSTVGGSISLGATVAQQGGTLTYETVTSGAVVTSVNPLNAYVNTVSAANASATASPQFSTFASGATSITLASVAVTGTGAVGTDLSTTINADGVGAGTTAGAASISVSLVSTALSDSNVLSSASGGLAVYHKNVAGGVVKAVVGGIAQYQTASAFNSGTVTFTLAAGAATYEGTTIVTLTYNGTTAISTAAAGTATLTLTAGGSSIQTPAGATGATAAVTYGANLSTQLDWLNTGSSPFSSFIRIHNTATVAGAATVVVKRDSTDGSAITTVGTYTTSTVPAGGTIQVSMGTIEAALGSSGGSYTVLITAPFPGYVQHISYNSTSGSLSDLSGFRQGGSAAGTANAP